MLYKLDQAAKSDYQKVKRTTLSQIGWQEKDLEKLLANHITDLLHIDELMTIFTERPRQEEPDILALNAAGELYIFELKRWQSNTENLLQALRYGQLYGNSSYDELNGLYKKYHNGAELVDAHKRYFNLADDAALKTSDYNKKQHFMIVTNGLDLKTIEAIGYWKRNGLNIDGIVYWVFEIAGEHFIEFNTYSPTDSNYEVESGCYVLNTNFSNNEQSHFDMLKYKKAAAYCPGWKEKIQKLQKEDFVFLYQTSVGIVAYGKADGKLNMKEWDNVPDDEYYMNLNDFRMLSNPLSAAEMKLAANIGFPFRTTMFSVDEDTKEKLMKAIKAKN